MKSWEVNYYFQGMAMRGKSWLESTSLVGKRGGYGRLSVIVDGSS